jgi:hypothetical protein
MALQSLSRSTRGPKGLPHLRRKTKFPQVAVPTPGTSSLTNLCARNSGPIGSAYAMGQEGACRGSGYYLLFLVLHLGSRDRGPILRTPLRFCPISVHLVSKGENQHTANSGELLTREFDSHGPFFPGSIAPVREGAFQNSVEEEPFFKTNQRFTNADGKCPIEPLESLYIC